MKKWFLGLFLFTVFFAGCAGTAKPSVEQAAGLDSLSDMPIHEIIAAVPDLDPGIIDEIIAAAPGLIDEWIEPETTTTNINTSLNGVWSRGDIVITITDNNGYFTEINSGSWEKVMKNGFIRVGARKLRSIIQTGDLRWTAQDLAWNAINIYEDASYRLGNWQNCIILMDEQGRTIQTITRGSDLLNPENTYTRVN